MTRSIEREVRQVLADLSGKSLDEITPDLSLDDLKLDSLEQIQLLFMLEEVFGVRIPDREAKKMRSVHEVVVALQALLGPDAEGAA